MIDCSFEDGNAASLRHVIVDTIVMKDGKILLVKRVGKLLEGGKWSLVGGFVERNETTKQAAARETLEEAGWKVKDMTLLRVNDNPDRPREDRQNVAFVYFCTAVEKVGAADWESDEQKWFDWSEIPSDKEIAFDHADDIKLYRKYLKERFALPRVG